MDDGVDAPATRLFGLAPKPGQELEAFRVEADDGIHFVWGGYVLWDSGRNPTCCILTAADRAATSRLVRRPRRCEAPDIIKHSWTPGWNLCSNPRAILAGVGARNLTGILGA